MSSLQTKVWQQIAGLVPLWTDFLLIDIYLLIFCI
ncbi:methionine aminopeptidase [Yersinia frederiksenii]|nr:methionine aminopeptidase [Yersinia frederiksenii]